MAPSPEPVDHRTDISVLGRFYNCHLGDIGQMMGLMRPERSIAEHAWHEQKRGFTTHYLTFVDLAHAAKN